MSKKVKLKKGKAMNLESLGVDVGKRVVETVAQDKGIFGQVMDFANSEIGKNLIDIGFSLAKQYIDGIGQPDIRKVQAVRHGSADKAVIPRSDAHEHLFKILNGYPAEQIAQILPIIEKLSDPRGMLEMLEMIRNPAKITEFIKDLMTQETGEE